MHLHKLADKDRIERIFEKFSGEIIQLPPVRSAVKRQERKRNVYYVDIIEIEGQDVLFRIGCQAGTYVRKYVYDLGKDLGCGAHMVQLLRTKAGPFTDKNMHTLHDLKDTYEFWKDGNDEEIRKIILPFEHAVDHLGKIWVIDGAVDPICHGANLYVVGISQLHDDINQGDLVALFTLKNELIGIGKAQMDSKEIIAAEIGVAVSSTKIFMERGIYSLKDIG